IRNSTIRDAKSEPAKAFSPASAKSATHSFSRGRISGRHKNFPVSFKFSAEIPRFVSSTSRAARYTSQHTSNASSGLTPIASPLYAKGLLHYSRGFVVSGAFPLLRLGLQFPLLPVLRFSLHTTRTISPPFLLINPTPV